jgi:tetratricopeptide (TPR) repeat protein
LNSAERQALTRLSIFRTRLDDEEFDYAGVDAATVRRWLDLSLLQRERIEGDELHSVHPVVREYLLGQVTPDARRELHTWAAAYHSRSFVEIARQAAAQSGQSWTDEEIEEGARSEVARFAVARTNSMATRAAAMNSALKWQHHLFAAGDYEAAGEIVTAVLEALMRWGERDRAKALVRGSIETREGFGKAVAQGDLANLLQDEGKLDEALAIHEQLYRTFEALGARQQMAAALSQIAKVYWSQGEYEQAIEYVERSLGLDEERGDEKGQAIALNNLSILYMLQGDYATALARSQEAEKLSRSSEREDLLAANLHEQGLILNWMAREAQTDEERMAHLAAAVERFQQSLAIERRMGNQAGAADTLGELGKLWRDAGQMREAIAAFTEALETFRRLGNPIKIAAILTMLGNVHEQQGQHTAALDKYEQALALDLKYGSPRDVEVDRQDIARVQAKLRDG